MTITPNDLTWMFQDPEWKNKFLIGSLLVLAVSMVPLLGLAGYVLVFGYALIEMRAQIRGEEPRLPKWENWGELFVDGLKAALAAIGYFLPGILVFVLGFLVFFILFMGGVVAQAGSPRDVTLPLFFLLGELVLVVSFGIGWLAFLVGMIPTPAAVGQYARTGKISAGYHWGEIRTILRANAGGFVLGWIIYWGLAVILSFVAALCYYTIVLCFFIPIIVAPVSFYLALEYAHLFGKAYREGALKASLLSA